jgi:hypothetical protein
MPHEFIRREDEPEPLTGGSYSGVPPRKHSAAGVLDPPFPPKKPLRPIPTTPRSVIIRLFVILILIGLAIVTLMLFRAITYLTHPSQRRKIAGTGGLRDFLPTLDRQLG